MFGIGAGELVIIAIVVLLAVGPDQMPKMLRTVGRGMRQVRRATRELQSTVGVDQLLSDDELRDPLGIKGAVKPKPVKPAATKPAAQTAEAVAARKAGLSMSTEDYDREQSHLGVDLDLAYARSEAAFAAEEARTAEAETHA